ncbi:MAG: ribonuclease H family protein [Johnsonella sp.]|nr:ribonuclease H family protein [Johnsonella sp.]
MAKSKYYAVRMGRSPGIYKSWEEAKKQVERFAGAQYKSFPSEEEARAYMEAGGQKKEASGTEDFNAKVEAEIRALREDELIAFVDGSYTEEVEGSPRYSFGAVLIGRDFRKELSGSYTNFDYLEARNVAGEIEGVKQSVLWAIEQRKKKLLIYYDYQGIESWAIGEWRTNKKLTREYAEFFKEKSKHISISFCHAKAHSGILYNERADELAKNALYSG